MPGVSKATATGHVQHGPVEDFNQDLDGYTVNFVSFAVEIDGAPFLKGLPEDRCQCPHWGYVAKGRATYQFADHDESFAAGEAFYVAPGHTPLMGADTELIQFSPTDDLQK